MPDATTDDARKARQQRKRDRSRDDILAAARAVLNRDGIAAVTLEAVAREAGMSKTGLYYYFSSKEALIFELVFAALQLHAERVHDAVEATDTGPAALGAVIRHTVEAYSGQMDDFRLAFLLGQVSSSTYMQMSPEQLTRIRPLNDMLLAGATRLLAEGKTTGQETGQETGKVEPRLLSFLAFLSAIGLLTMKGLVESQGDPLLYSDDQLIEALTTIFARAAS
jgi:AcrR family transcriptional regulator